MAISHYKNLSIIGTSHIATESVQEIQRYITNHKPPFVAVELDKQRYHALMQPQRQPQRLTDLQGLGLWGALFALIGSYVQRKLAKLVGTEPGIDMKHACTAAIENNAQLVLIDQPITITLRKFSKRFSWRERLRMIKEFFQAIFFRKTILKKYGLHSFDLNKVPPDQLIISLMKHLEQDYPNIYLTLVHERNEVMARKLYALMKHYPDREIFAVVGAGHKAGMLELLKHHFEHRTHIDVL